MNNNFSEAITSLFWYLIPMQVPSVLFFYILGIVLIKTRTDRGIDKIWRHIATVSAIIFFIAVIRLLTQSDNQSISENTITFYIFVSVICLAGAYVSSYRLVDISSKEIETIFSRYKKDKLKNIRVDESHPIYSINNEEELKKNKFDNYFRGQLLAARLPDNEFDYKSLSIQELVKNKFFSVRNEDEVMYLIFFSGHVAVESNEFLKVFNSFEECKSACTSNNIKKLHPPGSVLTLEMSTLLN